MATIIEFELPADEFALHETLTACPDATFEVERVVATAPDQITPYVWVQADDFDRLERAFESDPTVTDATLLSETDAERSYRMEWTGPIDLIVHLLTEQDGTITHADGRDNVWYLRVLFPDHTALTKAHDYAIENEFSLNVQAIYGMEDERHTQFGLTNGQSEALTASFERGYFKVPRDVSLTEFAEQEEISHQALSERLRRGINSLIEHTLIIGENGNEDDEQ
jgi:predicted DNA binding protein